MLRAATASVFALKRQDANGKTAGDPKERPRNHARGALPADGSHARDRRAAILVSILPSFARLGIPSTA